MDVLEQLKMRDERARALALACCDARRAEGFLEQGVIDTEDYKQIIRHDALNSSFDLQRLESALRKGAISHAEYVEISRKHYLHAGHINGKVALEGLSEGFITEDDDCWASWAGLWEGSKRYLRFEEYGELDDLEFLYWDKINLKLGTDIRKAARAVYRLSQMQEEGYAGGLDLERAIPYLKRNGFLLPKEIKARDQEYYRDAERKLRDFIFEFFWFVKSRFPKLIGEFEGKKKKVKVNKK